LAVNREKDVTGLGLALKKPAKEAIFYPKMIDNLYIPLVSPLVLLPFRAIHIRTI
jgi:hypothetical protein